MKQLLVLCFFFLCSLQNISFAYNNDTLPYSLFRDKIVLYSDLGFDAAPFTIKNNFPDYDKNLKFKHNIKSVLGFGIAYKWFGLRISFALPGTLKAVSRFGNPNYFNIGTSFNIKKTYCDFDFRYYEGYAIKNAYEWNDTLNTLRPNDIRPHTKATSFSTNFWYFKSKEFKMQAVFGKTGHFKESVKTWYYKTTINIFGTGNDGGSIIPIELTDSSNTKSKANAITALDMGIIPGYAYVHRLNNWQFSLFGGVGGVIQAKFYNVQMLTRGHLGLAPRVDLRFIAGYSKPKYFAWLVTDFDIKSIHFNSLKYNQTYYTIKLVGGVRLDKKKKSGKRD